MLTQGSGAIKIAQVRGNSEEVRSEVHFLLVKWKIENG